MESLSGNYISLLNEYQQKTQCTVEYEEGSTDGPSHNKTFTMRAIVNGQRYPDGTGKTKKEAKQSAAKNFLNGIKSTKNIEPRQPPMACSTKPVSFITQQTASTVQNIPNNMTVSQRNFTCWLNEYSQKNRLILKASESTVMDPGNTTQLCTYVCKYVCGDKEYPEAYGKNKKDAKEAAATRVYEEINKTQNAEVFDENSKRAQSSEVASRSASLDFGSSSFTEESRSSTPDNNYIAYLNHYCQKRNRVLDFNLVDKRGPPHNPEFVYKVVINGKEYPEGQGKSIKEAKQHAAQRAWSEIYEQSGRITQSSGDDSSSQAQEASKSQDEQHSSKSSPETPSSSSFIVFKDSSAVSSPMAINPPVLQSVSPLDVKSKVKLAPNFHLSPNGLASSKEVPKPSGGQTLNQATKSRFLEDFDCINPIGEGGFGRVFKARRKLEDTYYAVKIVKNTKKASREVAALAKFNKPNIVRYYSCWVEDMAYRHDSSESYSLSDSGSGSSTKFLYIQMEFCEGDTLRAWIDKRNSSDVQYPERRTEAAQINKQVLRAVAYIHSKGLIHRDLKPANIMFSGEGRVKVGDFGLVTAAENDNDKDLLERTRRTGTRIYMSLEQAAHTSYDKKVDIYALGLIYFELIWKFATVSEKHKIWENVRIRKFPPQFSKIYNFEHKLIDWMLSPRPEERPDASELISEMDRYSTMLKGDSSDSISGLSKNFDVIANLGEGSYGCVYKVKHKIDDKIYAVKRVPLTENADSEVKALSRLDHPNIVHYITCWPGSGNWTSNQERNQVFNTSGSSSDVMTSERDCRGERDEDEEDDDDTSGVESQTKSASAAEPSGNNRTDRLDSSNHSRTYLFIQMEFCEGGTLTDWIQARNDLKKQRIKVEIHKIFYEIITGVEFIHANNLIHRDLKPDNILFGADGKVKIGDLGLVAAQTDENGDPIERSDQGTTTYRSPEQETKTYDEKTDIFPLGLIWFEMIWKMSTGMERAMLWPDLRNQRLPKDFCQSYQTESKFIMKMLSYLPEHRLPAKSIKENLEKFFCRDQNLLCQKTI